ncbi:NrfD/PsrC family molybdoenzyme membrane anchor subunit [Streptomyces winkii]|uniref:NrfD/PsrC family molybdoenzyme membrane anchor subunit n=1 Tax=Streptomyces winkii TaxID=3051178 RepID=UPI0037D9AC2C
MRGVRPGRAALVGGQDLTDGDGSRAEAPGRGRHRGRRRRGRKGEQTVVPEAEFTSYYGRPVLNQPAWQPLNIAGYFFLGGLAGAGSVLAAGAELTGRPVMARALKTSSAVAVAGSAAALIHDLGRPGRFVNMLRVFKPTSPMSVGSWLLSAYGPAAGVAALCDLRGTLPRVGRAATAGAALLGPSVATYTAVLAADTAVPGWHDGYRELPFVFVGSAATAASGMALAMSPTAENGPARSAALAGTALENAALKAMERRLGLVAEVYRDGPGGRWMRAAGALSAAGAAGAALLAGRSRVAAAASGLTLLAASACTRLGVFHAGLESSRDPKYTVLPQRARLRRHQAAGPDGTP